MIVWVQILWEPVSPKFWRTKDVQNLVRFRTTLEFHREYLCNGSQYQQVENGVINYNLFGD